LFFFLARGSIVIAWIYYGIVTSTQRKRKGSNNTLFMPVTFDTSNHGNLSAEVCKPLFLCRSQSQVTVATHLYDNNPVRRGPAVIPSCASVGPPRLLQAGASKQASGQRKDECRVNRTGADMHDTPHLGWIDLTILMAENEQKTTLPYLYRT